MADGLSLSDLRREKEELQKDYEAFSRAYDLITRRILESNEAQPPREPSLHTWSGSRAVVGSLELVIHAVQRTIEEHELFIRRIQEGEIRNNDRPTLSLVKE